MKTSQSNLMAMSTKTYANWRNISPDAKSFWHQEYARTRDEEIIDKLVIAYEKLVHKITHQINKKCSEPYQDLFQLGNIGLIKALRRFDPGQKVCFSSFAVPYIRGEMLHYLRDHGTPVKIPRRWHEIHSRLTVLQRKQDEVNHQLQAVTLGITPDELTQVKQACQFTRSASKELPLYLADQGGESFEVNSDLLSSVLDQVSQNFKTQLSVREQQILEQLFINLMSIDSLASKHRLTHRQMVSEVNLILQVLAGDSVLVAAS